MKLFNKFFLLVFVGLIFSVSVLKAQIQQSEALKSAINLTVSEKFDQAETAFIALMKSEPTNADVYFYYGENNIKSFYSDTISSTLKETSLTVIPLFKKGIEIDTTDALNYIGLGRINYYLGNKTEADKNFAIALSKMPAMDAKIKKIKDPVRFAILLTKLAETYILETNTDTAKAFPYLRRALEVDPTNAQVNIAFGDAYTYINDGSNAATNYTFSLQKDPKSAVSMVKKGNIYKRAKNLTLAITYFEQAISIDKNFAPAFRSLGETYTMAAQYEKATANFNTYLELCGDNIPAKMRYVTSLYKSQNYKEAVVQIKQIFEKDSTSYNNLNRLLAYSYFEIKEYDNALYYIQKYIKNATADKVIALDYSYYGRAYGEKGLDVKAAEYLTKAIEMSIENVSLYTDMAAYHAKQKNYTLAAKAIETKVSQGEANAGDFYYLGKYYYQDKNWGKADTTFNTLFTLEADKIKPYKVLGLYYQANARSSVDTLLTGYAKIKFDDLLTEIMIDTVKYVKYYEETYGYLAYYELFNKNYETSAQLYKKVLQINPNNPNAKIALETPELKKYNK